MAARMGQKLKLLYIIDILKKYSDEEHPINATEICDKLASFGVTAERKAIYSDIQHLIEYGYDIVKTGTPRSGFFLGSREFETPEICLLTDAVRTAKFISTKKTRELVAKLDAMQSIYQTNRRVDDVFIDNTGKCKNEEIFYVIDGISRAIKEHKKITFKYITRTLKDGREIENVMRERKISPYAMTWQDDHYYLIGNYEKYDNLIHLRIDRMRSVTMLKESARPFSEVSEYKDVFDVSDYTKKLFGMFGGETDEITLRCSKSVLEQVTDRFGDDIFIKNVTETHFDFTVKAIISDALVTWVMNYGTNIEVIEPSNLKNMIKERSKAIFEMYSK